MVGSTDPSTTDPSNAKPIADVRFAKHLNNVDWPALRQDLIDDDFHNGRTTAQLQTSFENSALAVMAWHNNRCIATARALSDGVGNAYVIDVWTHSTYRAKGIGSRLMQLLFEDLQGQHIYLQTDDKISFYERLGFKPQPTGLAKIVGNYLVNSAPTDTDTE